ncbi:MAG: hypothetical protein WC421_01425 [Elusimicrobiales bacterium]
MGRAVKFVIAAALFPSALLACAEAGRGFWGIFSNMTATGWFCGGFALYAALHFALGGAGVIYVFAHELAHAAAAALCGYRVSGFSAGSGGGEVKVEGSSGFVALAPYCVPVYAVVCALAYGAASLKWDMSPYRGWFCGALGFFLSFHLVNTMEIIWKTKQSDLRQAGGAFFSLAVIIAANSLVLLLSFKLLYPRLISLRAAGRGVAGGTAVFWDRAGDLAARGAVWAWTAACAPRV